jgi:hypothetical protein
MEMPDLTALPRPRSSGGSLRSFTASMTAARRWGADPDGAFFFLPSDGGGDEAEGAAGSALQEADQKARQLRAGARRRRAAAAGTAIGEPSGVAIDGRRPTDGPACGCAAYTTLASGGRGLICVHSEECMGIFAK